jgi:hypothetical protein
VTPLHSLQDARAICVHEPEEGLNDGVALFGKGTPQLHSCCIVATLESGSPILEWPRDSRCSNADGKEERCDKVASVGHSGPLRQCCEVARTPLTIGVAGATGTIAQHAAGFAQSLAARVGVVGRTQNRAPTDS